MSNINELVLYSLLEENLVKRFRLHMLKRTIPTQSKVYAGQAAAKLAKLRNPTLDKRKTYYRKLYLALKEREQALFRSKARAMSMTK